MECKIVFYGELNGVVLYTPQDNLSQWIFPSDLRIKDLSIVEALGPRYLVDKFYERIVQANLVLQNSDARNTVESFSLFKGVRRLVGGEVRKNEGEIRGRVSYTVETPGSCGVPITGEHSDKRFQTFIRALGNRISRTTVNEREFLNLMDFLHKSFKKWHLSFGYRTVYFGPKKVWATDGDKAVVLPNNTGLRGMYRVLGFSKSDYEFKDGKPYAGAIYGGNCDPGILRVWENRPKHSPIVLAKDTAASINKATDKDGVVKVKITAGKCVLHHLDKHGELHMWEVETEHPDCAFAFTWKHHSHVLKSNPQIAYRQEPDGKRGWLLLGGCLLVVNYY